MDNENIDYHQVGMFWTHFLEDLERISEALHNAGYIICSTMHGDMIIMRQDDYDDDEDWELNHDDDDDGSDYGNIRPFPGKYDE